MTVGYLEDAAAASSPKDTPISLVPAPGSLDVLVADGYGLVGGIGRRENSWLMVYVRGPEGIIVSLAEQIG
jgi:hypothetical protein